MKTLFDLNCRRGSGHNLGIVCQDKTMAQTNTPGSNQAIYRLNMVNLNKKCSTKKMPHSIRQSDPPSLPPLIIHVPVHVYVNFKCHMVYFIEYIHIQSDLTTRVCHNQSVLITQLYSNSLTNITQIGRY